MCSAHSKDKVDEFNLTSSHIIVSSSKSEAIVLNKSSILGRSGCHTYVCKGTFNGQCIAIKSISTKYVSLGSHEVNEILTLKHHENIVKILFAKMQNQNQFIFGMELCDISLQGWIITKLPVIQPVEILRQATAGIAFLHENNITHGNLKPSNIFLYSESELNTRVKLSDFRPRVPLDFQSSTFTISECDATGWMAPELLRQFDSYDETTTKPELDHPADMFSLGCVFYFVMTDGRHPFGERFRRPRNILNAKYFVSISHIKNVTPGNACIVVGLTQATPSHRPNAKSLLHHHLFWSDEKVLKFFGQVSDYLEEQDFNSMNMIHALKNLTTFANYIIGSSSLGFDWKGQITKDILQEILLGLKHMGKETSNMESIFNLLNAVKYTSKFPFTIRATIGTAHEQVVDFWTRSKFPFLLPLICTYLQCEAGNEKFVEFFDNHLKYSDYRLIEAIELLCFLSKSKALENVVGGIGGMRIGVTTFDLKTEKEDDIPQPKLFGGIQIVNSQQGKLIVSINHLLCLLSQIGNRPVAIISINGKQRSGKSFLANQFIKYLKFNEEGNSSWLDKNLESDFEWKDDLEIVTSGIQVWHEPLYAKFNGKEIGVIVMDTQGLHDKNTSLQRNSIIFGLSVLLSSVFIYNEKYYGDDCLQFLRTYLEYANGGTNDGSNLERLTFQKLIFLMRDFQAEGYKHGYYDDQNCPPDQTKNLKQSIFGLSPGMHAEARDTRSGIENCFEDRGVYAMSSPGLKLPNLAQFKQSKDWEPQFRSSVVDFVTKFFSPEALFASTKRVFGQVVTAEQLKAYVSKWVQLIQETEGMVGSKTIFETTAEMFYNSKIEESLQEFKTKMKDNLDRHPTGILQSELINYSSLLVTSVEANFCNDRYLGGAALLELYRKKLRERLNGAKDDFYSLNEASIAAEKERQLREKERIESQRREEQQRIAAQRREEELQRQKAEAKQLAIQTAESHYHQAVNDFHVAEGKVQTVIANQRKYQYQENKSSKERFLGFHVGTSRWVEWKYDHAQYQQALDAAQAEKQRLQQRVNEAEHQVNVARNS